MLACVCCRLVRSCSQDIVSGSLIREHAWETKELNEMLWALKAPLHGLDADRDSRYNTPLMVDVGANVGCATNKAVLVGEGGATALHHHEALASNR